MGLTALIVWMLHKAGRRIDPTDGRLVFGVFLYVGAVVLWTMASFSFAKAKGYDADAMGGLLVLLCLLGFIFPIAPLLFPGIVILALEDKSRRSRR